MAMITNLVVASKSDAKLIAETPVPTKKWQGLEGKTVEHIKFCTLWVILEGGKLPDVPAVQARINQMEVLHQVSEDGPWVFLIPRLLRDLIAGCSAKEESKTNAIATAWGLTEEFESWKAEEVSKVFKDIVVLGSAAKSEDKELMLWIRM